MKLLLILTGILMIGLVSSGSAWAGFEQEIRIIQDDYDDAQAKEIERNISRINDYAIEQELAKPKKTRVNGSIELSVEQKIEKRDGILRTIGFVVVGFIGILMFWLALFLNWNGGRR